jgi:hypothetical protein
MRDTDGTMWREVVLSVRVEVMAETDQEAAYYGFLKLPDLITNDELDQWNISAIPEIEVAE